MLKRLSVQIYLTIVGSLLLVVMLGATAMHFLPDGGGPGQVRRLVSERILPVLPPVGAAARLQREAVEEIQRTYPIDLALYDSRRRLIASAGDRMPRLGPNDRTGSRLRGRGGFPAWVVGLPDGRWIVMRHAVDGWHPAFNLIALLGAVSFAVAIGAYPIVRRLTRRLERLQAGVEQLGGGDLTARVNVAGSDEIAQLAQSFNKSAERIEALVGAHRLLLANVSHELRTPLSRIRIGVEFLKRDADPQRQAALKNDIAELDRLIDQILLSSRLDALDDEIPREDVDLLALAAEEGSRYRDCSVSGSVAIVSGEPMLLRQLIRNLIENGQKHGIPPVEVHISQSGGQVRMTVTDQGPGVRGADRERVFEPFYRAESACSAGGTGLGLALVRQIARRHGGEAAWCDDGRPGCILISLPAQSNRLST